jgi:hypothetical protein
VWDVGPWYGYAALILGFGAAVASIGLAIAGRNRQTGRSELKVAADVQASIVSQPDLADVPPQLAEWEQHAARIAQHQLDIYIRHSASTLRQSNIAFRLGMTAASIGFLALLASLGWLLWIHEDRGWFGVIGGVVSETVGALFFAETRATRARVTAMFNRAQAEADRVVRARGALSLLQELPDGPAKDTFLLQIGQWLLGGDQVPSLPAASARKR